jgi:polyphosphate kinase
MNRNLERRIELLFPVTQKNLMQRLVTILSAYFKDNTHAWDLQSDGRWVLRSPEFGEQPFRVQEWLYQSVRQAYQNAQTAPREEFVVRRKSV